MDEQGPLERGSTNHRFWLRLLGLCTACACLLALMLALLSVTSAWAFAADKPSVRTDQGASSQRVIAGVISDSSCRARHVMTDKTAAECMRQCARQGARTVLVSGDHVYLLEGHSADLQRLAGQRATVTGTVRGKVVHVASIAAQ